MKADLTKELKEIKHPSFKVSSSYCDRNRVSKRAVVNEILSEKRMEKKEEKYKEIDFFFDYVKTDESTTRSRSQLQSTPWNKTTEAVVKLIER